VKERAPREHVDHGKVGATALALGALGVVYGDIGTSPLYSLKEAFTEQSHRLAVDEINVYGVCSLAFWSLVIIISIKYLMFVMRADNEGEGGILALTALVMPKRGRTVAKAGILVSLGVFGTSLLYGDGIITPAISVLSAVEGLEEVSTSFERWVIPIAIVILIGLFAVQRQGTGAVGKVFGPVMMIWFATMAALGLWHIRDSPAIIKSGQPRTTRSSSSATRAPRRSCRWVPSSWSSPVVKRCTRTWGTSVADRSPWVGTAWSCRRCCSTTGVRGRSCWGTPKTSTACSSGWPLRRCCCRS
jgi:K+ transporter